MVFHMSCYRAVHSFLLICAADLIQSDVYIILLSHPAQNDLALHSVADLTLCWLLRPLHSALPLLLLPRFFPLIEIVSHCHSAIIM